MAGQRVITSSSYAAHIAYPLAGFRGLSAKARIFLSLVVLGLVAASLYLVPTYAAYGLALLGLGVPLLLLVWLRPEIGLLAILVATASIVFEDRLPLIPIGIGSLHVPDLLLLTLFGLVVLRCLAELDFKITRTPLDLPLLSFYGTAVLSTSIAVFRSSVEFRMAIQAIRVVTYYLTFFIVINVVREERQLRLLLRGILLLATIVAAAMIAQFLLGESVAVLPGRVETLRTQGKTYEGVTRMLPPGQSLVVLAFVTATVALVLGRSRPISLLRFAQWALLGLALVLTFLRSYWLAIGVVLFLLACLVRGQDKQRLMGWSLVVMCLAAIVLLVAHLGGDSRVARVVSAFLARLGTFGSSATLGESSLQWRYVENEYAIHQIASHPLLGLGLGARYRPWDPRLDWKSPDGTGFDGRAFLHNGHLWIMMKSGLLGYLCLMWLSLVFLLRGFKYWRSIPNHEMRGSVLGFTLTYLGLLIAAAVNSTFVQWFWTPVIGIMMGMNEVALREVVQERPRPESESGQDLP